MMIRHIRSLLTLPLVALRRTVIAAARLTLLVVASVASAASPNCGPRYDAGYRVLTLSDGRSVAVWYPAATSEARHEYSRDHGGFFGSVAKDAPPAACGRHPLVLFSHGLGGCAIQSIFLTEELARHGYVVAGADHRDALCSVAGSMAKLGKVKTDASFFDPKRWNERSNADRMTDLREIISLVARDSALAPITHTERIGAIGHSLGGYAVIGMAGGWPSWKEPRIQAVLALSAYVLPFMERGTLGALGVPVMYQGAELDIGITPSLLGPKGAYAQTAAPKYLAKLKGGSHFEWTNLLCAGESGTVTCLKKRPNAYLIDIYAIDFLDHHLKRQPPRLLHGPGKGLAQYQHAR